MENIEVAIRIRPANFSELSTNDLEIWDSLSQETIGIPSEKYTELLRYRKIVPGQKTSFNFNTCYNQTCTNQQIYDKTVKRIALSSLQGINGTVFMYGQTGSGKTFTVMGSKTQSNPLNFQSRASHKRPPLPQTHEFVERTPYHAQKTGKTPNKLSATSIANVQIDLNSLISDSESEKTEKILRNGGANLFENCDANPLKRGTSECLFEDAECEGVLSLALKDLFCEMAKKTEKKYFLRCSYLEIYTDLVFDLLKDGEKMSETLVISEDFNKEFFVKGATDEVVSCVEDALNILKRGECNRHYAATMMNHHSSRSHTIFRLFMQCISSDFEENKEIITESILNFVDLAGSEKISIHDSYYEKTREKSLGHHASSPSNHSLSSKDRVNESKHINKSLFFLTQVISLKSQGKPDMHIPFRNSPLTKILRSSLGGNSRTAIILCVNPCFSQFEQTLSTIRFGLNAKKIENQVTRNIISSNNDEIIKSLLGEYEKKLQEMEKEKREDRKSSQNLLKIIETLQQQQALMEERLSFARKNEEFHLRKREKEVFRSKTLRNRVGDYVHCKNVGILHINSYLEDPKTQLKFDSEGKFALEGLKILQKQEKLWVDKERVLTQELSTLTEKYSTVLEKINNLEAKLSKKRAKIATLSQKNKQFSQDNARFSAFFAIFEEQSSETLAKLSKELLSTLEETAISLQDRIRSEKMLRSFACSLKNQDIFKENAEIAVNSLRISFAKGLNLGLFEKFLKELQVSEENFPKRCETREISRESESFRSYFEEKRDVQEDSQKFVKDDEEICEKARDTQGFEGKLAEMQGNFVDIRAKIKEKVAFSQENDRILARKEANYSPGKGVSLQNKENFVKFASFSKGSLKKSEKFASPFKKHLEALRYNSKIV